MLDMGAFARTKFAVTLAAVAGFTSGLPAQSTAPAAPAKTTLVEPPAPLLPQHFTGWTLSGDATSGQDDSVADSANAQVLKEDGMSRFATGTYTHEGGKGSLAVSAMQFVDATGAFSAYSFYRSQLAHAREVTGTAKVGSDEVTDGETTLFLAGTTVVRLKGSVPAKELATLAAVLPKPTGRVALQPLLPTYVPAKGLIPGSIRYALGPAAYKSMGGALDPSLLGFSKAGEALTADYAGRGGKGTLTLLLYPTPQIAGDTGRAIETAMNAPGVGSHGSMGTVKMRRIGPLVGVTSGAFTSEQAEDLIHSLRLDQQVSFDQKMPLEFHAEVHKTASLLQNILVFSGVLALASLLLGIFLGGGRAWWRVLHGKPAATEPEFLTINLRGQPHAIVSETVPSGTSSGISGDPA